MRKSSGTGALRRPIYTAVGGAFPYRFGRLMLATWAVLTIVLSGVSYASQYAAIVVTPSPSTFAVCFDDDSPGLRILYVVAVFHDFDPASALYRVDVDPGFTASLLSTTNYWPDTSGHPYTGTVVRFQTCLSDNPQVLQALNFWSTTSSCPESWIRVVPDPNSGLVGMYTCDDAFVTADVAYFLAINPNGHEYLCDGLGDPLYRPLPPRHVDGSCATVPVSPSTWGRIKVLYE
jgi:hypothetical protein